MWHVLSCQPLTHVSFHLRIFIFITYQQKIQSFKKLISKHLHYYTFFNIFFDENMMSSNTHSLVKPWHMNKACNLMYLCRIF
jgi:hypothetical protein